MLVSIVLEWWLLYTSCWISVAAFIVIAVLLLEKNAIAISTSLAFLKCDAAGENEKSQKQNHENDAKFKFC